MPFKKGHAKCGGRRPGMKNHTTRNILEKSDELINAAMPGLLALAESDPKQIIPIWTKRMPSKVDVDGKLDVKGLLMRVLSGVSVRTIVAEEAAYLDGDERDALLEAGNEKE